MTTTNMTTTNTTTTNTTTDTIDCLKLSNTHIKNYIDSLTSIEYKALTISIRELESSFSIEKSIGFIEYLKNQSIP